MNEELDPISIEVPTAQITKAPFLELERELRKTIDQFTASEDIPRNKIKIDISLSIIRTILYIAKQLAERVPDKSGNDYDMADEFGLKKLKEKTASWPETHETALFAYRPEQLKPKRRREIETLFNNNASFKNVVESARKNREWLAPQYGL
jgi:hypothetical protein